MPVRRAAPVRAGPLGAPDQPRPDAEGHRSTLTDGRKLTGAGRAAGLLREGRPSTSRTRYGADVDERHGRGARPIWGEVLDGLARDPMDLRRPAGLAGQAAAAGGLPRARRAGLGRAPAAPGRPAVLRRAHGQGPLQPAGRPRLDASGWSPRSRSRAAMTEPPEDTRAYFRGRCLERYPAEVAAASWDSVIFDLGRESLVRIPTLEPLRGTRRHVGELIDDSPHAPRSWWRRSPAAEPIRRSECARRDRRCAELGFELHDNDRRASCRRSRPSARAAVAATTTRRGDADGGRPGAAREARRGRRRHPRRDRRRAGGERRGLRPRLRPEGRRVTSPPAGPPGDRSPRYPDAGPARERGTHLTMEFRPPVPPGLSAYLAPGPSSFTDFLTATAPAPAARPRPERRRGPRPRRQPGWTCRTAPRSSR